jgi:hypothetical protein
MKKGLPVVKITENCAFLEPKIRKLQCTHLKCPILKLFCIQPSVQSHCLYFFYIYLQLPSMIPWIFAATVSNFIEFCYVIFYSLQVLKLKNEPSYISISNH